MRPLTIAALLFVVNAVTSVTYAAGGELPLEHPEHQERHPEMRHALHALEKAREALQHAAHDFGGHRAKALELTDQAIREVKEGLEFDRR